jgi:predicted ester cyclase
MGENEARIRRIFDEIVNEDRLELIDELFDPEFTTDTAQGVLDRDGFRQFVAGWRAGFEDIHCEVGDVVESGDDIAWSVRAAGTHTGEFMSIPATGRRVEFDSLNVGTFRDGLAYRHKVVMDLLAVMIQLGVVPAPATAGAG